MSVCGFSDPVGPKAWPVIHGRADIKTCNQDFVVDEFLDFEPSGTGEHLYLRVQKDGENTAFVSRALADVYGVSHGAVSYAGMKDRHALTSQWFSIHLPQPESPLPAELESLESLENVTVLACTRHLKKLRRGQIKKNQFVVVLRGVSGEHRMLEQRLKHITQDGFPNYFGEQRFGSENLPLALQWMDVRRTRKIPGFKKALYISVLRSFLFNRVLSARIQQKNWNRVIPGEHVLDMFPTGPLWGRGSCLSDLNAKDIEQAAIAPYPKIMDALEHVGLTKEQRNLVAVPSDMEWVFSNDTLCLRFSLAKGEYATSMLREIADIRDANPYATRNTIPEIEKV